MQAEPQDVLQSMLGPEGNSLLPFIQDANSQGAESDDDNSNVGRREMALVFKFANNYGASLISHRFSYGWSDGLMEIAVLDKHNEITYETTITNDVIGWLSASEALIVLEAIKALPAID